MDKKMFQPEDQRAFRDLAQKCAEMAETETDQTSRLALLAAAQKWLEAADGELKGRRFDQFVDEFNRRQMRPEAWSNVTASRREHLQLTPRP
jgi:site-specific recombinase